MPTYEALIEVPDFNDYPVAKTQLSSFVEALREYAYPRFSVQVEARSKRAAAKLLSQSTGYGMYEHFRNSGVYEEDWWFDKLVAVRGKRAQS